MIADQSRMALVYRRNRIKVCCLLAVVCIVFVITWNRFGGVSEQDDMKRDFVKNLHQQHKETARTAAPVISPMKAPNDSNARQARSYTAEAMKKRAMTQNYIQTIWNLAKFGDHRADDPVIVIQSHDRPEMLKTLLDSLRKVKGIDGATIVVSRDKFTPEMDAVVDGIDFCRYIEVYFPFSMQIYPNAFPGEDPNDCPRDLSKEAAREKKCNNAEFPDMYGHYREVVFVQIKHHWFWKLNMVFSGIRSIQDNTGPIVMLEDDNYVSPDLIDVMRKAMLLREAECRDCLAITLGAYDFTTDYRGQGSSVDLKPWHSSKHNIGMLVTKVFYDSLIEYQEYFCTYDDYNWDWTLQSTALKKFPKHLTVMVLKVPRVYHLGCTGFHQKESGVCDLRKETEKLVDMFQTNQEYLFPHSFRVESRSDAPNSAHIQNGGWGDLRDHDLCQSYKRLCNTFLAD